MRYKVGLAISKGAVGAIPIVNSPVTPFRINNALSPDKKQAYGGRYIGNADLLMTASYPFLNNLFQNSGKNVQQVINALKSGKQSFDLPRNLSVQFASTWEDKETFNVVGMIPGVDKNLKSEYVVHTAHLDHVGVGPEVGGDSIYNGAHDNASGVASLLEIARLYKTTGVKPRRSVIIAMVSAEESGLLGSAYFASNPTVPKQAIVANLNTDMPVVIAPIVSVIPLGAAHSSLSANVAFATKALGLEVQEDPEPEENFFVRSDQYSFVRERIPALHIKAGRKSNVPGMDLDAYVKAWRAKYYHRPADQLEGGLFNFGAAKTYVLVNFLTSYSVAMENERPHWNPGELF
jgi:Zn-dependent M28 family amino/carboxypeptidase